MKSKSYLITHLSDLHLTRNDSDARSEPKLFGKLQGMNNAFLKLAGSARVNRSDYILFTGDITDRGDPEAWDFFWRTLTRYNLRKKSIIIPGNHDMCCLGTRLPRSGKKLARRDLHKFHAGLAVGDHPVLKYPCGIRLNPHMTVFAIDSCNKGNSTRFTNAMGQLGYHQLERFARELYKFRHTKIKIVALHHSPNIPGNKTAVSRGIEEMSDLERWGMEMAEEDRRSLRLLCVSHRVRLVLHGHIHRAENRRINGIRYIGAPASTEPKNGKYEFYTYTVSTSTWRIRAKLVSV